MLLRDYTTGVDRRLAQLAGNRQRLTSSLRAGGEFSMHPIATGEEH